MPGAIDDFCEALRSELHAKKLKDQADLERIKELVANLEGARQGELVQTFAAGRSLRAPAYTGPSGISVARLLLEAVRNLAELQVPIPTPSAAPAEPSPPAAKPRAASASESRCLWPQLLKESETGPIVVVGGSPRPEKLDATLGDLAPRVEWIETSRQGTHAIGNLAHRIRQRRVSALIVLDAAVGHKHSEPLVSAAREVKIPTTYAHKGGVAALARAFTLLEKMVGAR